MILAVHSYGGANDAFFRHFPYYKNSGATRIVGIGTEKGDCVFPEGCDSVIIGDGKYMEGANLCQRLLDTLEWFLKQPQERMVLCEYDVIFLRAIKPWIGLAADFTGTRTWGSQAPWIAHNPWCFDKATAALFLRVGQVCIQTQHVSYGKPDSSPDVFFGWVCSVAGIEVNHGHFTLFTRNSLDIPGDLALAREAYRNGVDVIHGLKTAEELEFITT